jgi:hypothetical protein
MITITVRIHRVGGDILVAACDRELLGNVLREGELKLEVRPAFYEGEDASEELLLNRLNNATMANLVGEKTVGLAIKHKFIDEDRILYIGGVPHAQLVKM